MAKNEQYAVGSPKDADNLTARLVRDINDQLAKISDRFRRLGIDNGALTANISASRFRITNLGTALSEDDALPLRQLEAAITNVQNDIRSNVTSEVEGDAGSPTGSETSQGSDEDDEQQPFDGDLLAIADLVGTGILSRVGDESWALTSGTAGRVMFWDATANRPDDDPDLFWDDANKVLAIGGLTNPDPITRLYVIETGADANVAVHSYDNSAASGGRVWAMHSRGTRAAPLALQANDLVGSFMWEGQTDTGVQDYNFIGAVEMFASENYTPAATGSHMTFSTTPIGTNNPTEKMRILGNGAVGIGLTDPIALMHINEDNGAADALFLSETNRTGGSCVYAGYKTRGTHAVPTAVQSGDNLFTLLVLAHDGDPLNIVGAMEWTAIENFTNTLHGNDLRFYTTPTGSATLTEAMRISGASNLLVGTGTDVTGTRVRVIGGNLEAALLYGGTATSSDLTLQPHNGSFGTEDAGRIQLRGFVDLIRADGGTINATGGGGPYNFVSSTLNWVLPTTVQLEAVRGFNFEPTFQYDAGIGFPDESPAFRAHPIYQALASGDPADGGFLSGFESSPTINVVAGRSHTADFLLGMHSHPQAFVAAAGTLTLGRFAAYQAWGGSTDTTNAGTLTADDIICYAAGNPLGVSAWGTRAIAFYVENMASAAAGSRFSLLSTASGMHMRHVGNTTIGLDAAVAASEKLRVHQPSIGSDVFRLDTAATNDDPNYIVRHGRVATTDATVTTLMSYTLTAANAYLIEARVVAHRTGGIAGAADDSAVYIVYAGAKHTGGVAALIGAVGADYTDEDQAAWNATIDVDGANAVRVRVTGAANNNITWHCTLIVQNLGT